jgi:hypothetical protein
VADGLRGRTAGIRITLTAMLFSGGRAALAHQRLPRVQAPQRPAPASITEDRRSAILPGTSANSCWCSHSTGLQAGPPGRYRRARSAGRWPLPAALGLSQQGRRGPTAQKCTHFARWIRRRAGQLAALATHRASLSRLTAYHRDGPRMRASRLPAPAACWLCAPADQPRYTVPRDARRQVRRRLRARWAGAYWRTIAVTM